jgi:hypothetical protein
VFVDVSTGVLANTVGAKELWRFPKAQKSNKEMSLQGGKIMIIKLQ